MPILKGSNTLHNTVVWSLIELASPYTVLLSAVNGFSRLTTTSNGQTRPIRKFSNRPITVESNRIGTADSNSNRISKLSRSLTSSWQVDDSWASCLLHPSVTINFFAVYRSTQHRQVRVAWYDYDAAVRGRTHRRGSLRIRPRQRDRHSIPSGCCHPDWQIDKVVCDCRHCLQSYHSRWRQPALNGTLSHTAGHNIGHQRCHSWPYRLWIFDGNGKFQSPMIQLGCGIDSRFPLNTRSVSSPQGSSFITTPRQIATKKRDH